jgi:hypothetical protein
MENRARFELTPVDLTAAVGFTSDGWVNILVRGSPVFGPGVLPRDSRV